MTGSVFKPYWSKQHGAYLTLITCWLIAVLLSHSAFKAILLQFTVLVCLLSGLNAGELFIEKLKRKTALPDHKRVWLYIYMGLTCITAVAVVSMNPLSLSLLPFLAGGGGLLIMLSAMKLHKSIVVEWITFALFSLAGLLAYSPGSAPETSQLIKISLLMSIYFGISIFSVKAWLSKLAPAYTLIYALVSFLVLIIIYGFSALILCISLLLLLKAIPVTFLAEHYRRLKIMQIGISETVTNVVFILILYIFYQ